MRYKATLKVRAVQFRPQAGAITFPAFGWDLKVYWYNGPTGEPVLRLPFGENAFVEIGQWLIMHENKRLPLSKQLEVMDNYTFQALYGLIDDEPAVDPGADQ